MLIILRLSLACVHQSIDLGNNYTIWLLLHAFLSSLLLFWVMALFASRYVPITPVTTFQFLLLLHLLYYNFHLLGYQKAIQQIFIRQLQRNMHISVSYRQSHLWSAVISCEHKLSLHKIYSIYKVESQCHFSSRIRMLLSSS